MPPGITICPAASIDPAGAERGEAARRADRDDLFALDADIGLFRAGGKDGEAAGDHGVEHAKSPLIRGHGRCGPDRRSPRARRGEGETREDFVGRDVVDDKDEPAALVGVGPGVEPFRREHRVLRRLHDGRPVRAVGEAHEALDPQQIVAAVLRQPAERAREIEAADRAVEDDREGRDAVGVGRLGAGRRSRRVPPPCPPPPAGEGEAASAASPTPSPAGGGGLGWGLCVAANSTAAGSLAAAPTMRSAPGFSASRRSAQRGAERREVGLRDRPARRRPRPAAPPRRSGRACRRRSTASTRVTTRAEAQPLVEHRVGAEGEQDRRRDRRDRWSRRRCGRNGRISPASRRSIRLRSVSRQILAHRAAQAAAGQFEHLPFDEIDEVMVDRDLADLVDDDGGVGKRRVRSGRGAAASSCRCRETRSAASTGMDRPAPARSSIRDRRRVCMRRGIVSRGDAGGKSRPSPRPSRSRGRSRGMDRPRSRLRRRAAQCSGCILSTAPASCLP